MPLTKISINTASLEELQTLNGVGPKIAQHIAFYRQDIGYFRGPDDLAKVKGISQEFAIALAQHIDWRIMGEFWKGLYQRTFSGNGYITYDYSNENWECRFWFAQLLNGRIVTQISVLEFPNFLRMRNFIEEIDAFSIEGILDNGHRLKATNINLSWSVSNVIKGGYFEGYVLQPGFVEITREEQVQILYSKVDCQVTNLSLGKHHKIEAHIGRAKLKLYWLPNSNDILRQARGVKTARVRSAISINFSEPNSENTEEGTISILTGLLTLAQRSHVFCVASHWQDVDGITQKSRYQEPVFHYPPSPRPLIPAKALANFIETSFENYSKKWKTWRLAWAIDYYAQAMSLDQVLAQSIGFFTALETLKDAFLDEDRDLELYVNEKQFEKKIRRDVRKILTENFETFKNLADNKEGKKILAGQINGLNRRAYRLVLVDMFQELKMDVDKSELEALVKLRNKIIHTGIPDYQKDPNMREAANLMFKFAGVVERTILAILDYHGDCELYNQSVSLDG